MNELDIINKINTIGCLLLKHGAEIYRVEESLTRMYQGLGYKDVEVFAVPTYFTVSLTLKDGTAYHASKRSRSNRVHLDHLFELNNLVRQISNNELTFEEIDQAIYKITNDKLNLPYILIGYIVSAAMFCVFFGGGIAEMLVSAVIGYVLYYFIYLMEILNINSIVRTILSSIVLAAMAIIAFRCHLVQDTRSIITGTLMILVPGIAITNSLRDIMSGDFVSGVSRMAEAILIAASIAIGVGATLMVLGGVA